MGAWTNEIYVGRVRRSNTQMATRCPNSAIRLEMIRRIRRRTPVYWRTLLKVAKGYQGS